MLLRVSGEADGKDVDVHAVTDREAAASSGVAHAETLVRFTDAVVSDDDEALDGARAELLGELGPEGLVDAAAVASNFERMVRIADSTGIPLDTPLEVLTGDMREELHLDRFGSSANTPEPRAVKRTLGRVLRPVAIRALRLFAARRRGFRAS